MENKFVKEFEESEIIMKDTTTHMSIAQNLIHIVKNIFNLSRFKTFVFAQISC